MDRFEQLTTPRLILRRLRTGDETAIHAYRSRPEVACYQSWHSFSREDAASLVKSQLTTEPNIPGGWFQLAITVAATDVLAGDCGLYCCRDDPRQMELGITLAPEFQGYGYATETVRRLLAFVFEDLEIHRLSATTDAENVSAAALFRRLGFRQEAHHIEHLWFKGAWGSEFIFAMLRREWLAQLCP